MKVFLKILKWVSISFFGLLILLFFVVMGYRGVKRWEFKKAIDEIEREEYYFENESAFLRT